MVDQTQRTIVIFGGSACEPGDPVFEAARALGEAMARRGWAVATGGYGGAMLAASQGAAEAGGKVLGVTCSIFRSAPNRYLTEAIATDNLYDRLRGLIELGDGYLVLPGSTGTLAELAMVWELLNKRLLPPRPVICWGEFWRPVVEVFAHDRARDPRLVAPAHARHCGELIRFAQAAAEVMRLLEEAFEETN